MLGRDEQSVVAREQDLRVVLVRHHGNGAISHNIGQFIVISLIYTGTNMWFYLPLLIIAGVATGLLTAGILKVILPAVNKLVK